jgi:hypothetical protein
MYKQLHGTERKLPLDATVRRYSCVERILQPTTIFVRKMGKLMGIISNTSFTYFAHACQFLKLRGCNARFVLLFTREWFLGRLSRSVEAVTETVGMAHRHHLRSASHQYLFKVSQAKGCCR